MDGGDSDTTSSTVHLTNSSENVLSKQLSTLSLNTEKDPRIIARKYQIDLCKKASQENVIVYIGTGCGKTHIAVLLIYEMRHLIKKPQHNKKICVFLAPTVALVQQQAKVIENSLDLRVGVYCGNSTHLKGHHDWEKEIDECEVLVMTPQILLHYLSHCFIKIEQIALLIFDECHYAQLDSNHPYAEIMKIFYKMDLVNLPRIFGMTASPKLGKGGSIDGLEALMRAKVYSVEDKDELEQFITSPKVNVYYYDSSVNGSLAPQMRYIRKLEEIKHQFMSTIRMNMLDQSSLRNAKKLLLKLHSNLQFCLEKLGLWGALQASHILIKGDHYENGDLSETEGSCSDDNVCNKYLQQAAKILADCTEVCADGVGADLSCVEVLKEPYISKKLSKLIDILSSFRLQPNMKCIIFVNRIVTARSLSHILRNLKFLSSWKCGFLVGVHAGLVSRKNTTIILEKFRSGELNLLVATKVGEEGLDIQTCCLVIRFDLPETVASFIQSRGRARMPQSEYAFLVDRGNQGELKLIEHFTKDEAQMNEEISCRSSHVPVIDFEERTYKVDTTGATISSVSSVSLLHRFCSKLPHDEFFNPRPQFFYYDKEDGTICSIILPANAPIHQITSTPQPSMEEAKRDACLEACKELHEVGALTDYLLPEQDNGSEEPTIDSPDYDSCDDNDSRAELHEMLVPAALRERWAGVGNSTCFSSYYVQFCPNPADRIYREFGLYVKDPLPEEAEKMKLDLCLARGRMVMTQLIPSGSARFDQDEIELAEKFQRMSLKVILDRHKLIPECVSLEDDDVYESSSSTFYLLLPIVQHEYAKISVDWRLVKKCLSSQIFRQPETGSNDNGSQLKYHLHLTNGTDNEVTQLNDPLHLANGTNDEGSQLKNQLLLANGTKQEVSQLEDQLHLADGCKRVLDILDSLVYVPCKDIFFFISDIIPEKNGYSLYDDSKSHLEHYTETFDIHLVYPDQPLLKAKQLFVLDNLLRKKNHSGEWKEKEEHFIELPPEICQLKIIGFSKEIGSSLSLLPSIMHRLENLLVAIELKNKLVASFPEGAEVTAHRVLEALTTERCCEHFSLERLEVLGDAFLKFAVARHLFLKHSVLDEGQLTRKRSSIVNNSNLFKLATRNNLQVYIRDYSFEADEFFAFGRPCLLRCTKENEKTIHPLCHDKKHGANDNNVRCNKCHHWLHKKTIADVIEALIGAFIVDSGFKAAAAFLKWLGIPIDFTVSQIDNMCSASKVFLPLSNQIDVKSIEKTLGYTFTHKGLLIQAFIHPSFNNHFGGCYQRLEFLGDAVLDYLITSYLYTVYPKLKPGQLTDLRSASVNNISFAEVAGQRSFHKFIICDSSVLRESINKYVNSILTSTSVEEHVEDRACPKVLGDLVESCMGAVFLDTGFNLNCTWNIMLALLDPIVCLSKLQFNPLRDLGELCQYHNWELQSSSLKKNGKFSVELKVEEGKVSVTASATNTSGKAAKRMAAREVFESLKAQGYRSKSKSLEEVLMKTEKKEAKLIGYDENPSDVTAIHGPVNVQKASQGDCVVKMSRPNMISTTNSDTIPITPPKASVSHVNHSIHRNGCHDDPPAIHLNNSRKPGPQGIGASCAVTARSHLYEICTANCWKPPVFECCEEMGPSHIKEFIFKVVLEIEEMPNHTFEYHGESRLRKKDAAEHAAEGALWYLKQEGYVLDKKSNK